MTLFSSALSSVPEERAQQTCGLPLADARIDLGPMVAGRLVEDARAVLDAAALGIGGAIVKAPDPGEGDRLGAHRAGLQRDVEIAVDQPRRTELCGCHA